MKAILLGLLMFAICAGVGAGAGWLLAAWLWPAARGGAAVVGGLLGVVAFVVWGLSMEVDG